MGFDCLGVDGRLPRKFLEACSSKDPQFVPKRFLITFSLISTPSHRLPLEDPRGLFYQKNEKLSEKEKYLCVTSNHALLYLGLKVMQQLHPPATSTSQLIDFRFVLSQLSEYKISESLFLLSRYQSIWLSFLELATSRGGSENVRKLPERAWNHLAAFSIEHNVCFFYHFCSL